VDTLSVTGIEQVRLQFRTAGALIQFNSLDQKLDHVQLDGKPVQSVDSDDAKQLSTVRLKSPAPAGVHVLRFAFTGKLQTGPRGLFVQKYTRSDGSEGVMLSTQMESTDARRMFPCWDEPAFRAAFRLEVSVPAAWASVSNMPIERRVVRGDAAIVRFRETPKMPSYLIEFTAGELREINAKSGSTSIGVCPCPSSTRSPCRAGSPVRWRISRWCPWPRTAMRRACARSRCAKRVSYWAAATRPHRIGVFPCESGPAPIPPPQACCSRQTARRRPQDVATRL
jgi:hypothetical protein